MVLRFDENIQSVNHNMKIPDYNGPSVNYTDSLPWTKNTLSNCAVVKGKKSVVLIPLLVLFPSGIGLFKYQYCS